MTMRTRRLCRCLAAAALISGAVWAWYGMTRTRETTTPREHSAASPAPAGEEVRPPPIEPIQLHLIPRIQPTPLSPYGPPRPLE
jgi:hypothetical protein